MLARVKTHIELREKLLEKKQIEKQLQELQSANSPGDQERDTLEVRKAELENVTLFYDLRSQLDKLILEKNPVARM